MPKLSVLYAVKNEEAFIGKSLASVADIADQIVIVETGCADKTLSICRQFRKVKVVAYSWSHDFSKPKNFGLTQCTGDWVLCMDADEMLDPKSASAVRGAVDSARANMGAFALHLVDHEESWEFDAPRRAKAFFESPQVRLFRAIPNIRFQGKVLESVKKTIPQGMAIDVLDASIHHFLWKGRGPDFADMRIRYYNKLGANLPSPAPAKDGAREAEPEPEKPPATVAICLCAHNVICATKQCLASVEANTVMPYKLCLADNGSVDETRSYMRDVLGHEPIFFDRNEGVAKARNWAAKEALGDPAIRYVCFLDNDTRVYPGWLEAMVKIMEDDPGVGMVGPLTDRADTAQNVGDHYHETDMGLVKERQPALFNVNEINRFCMVVRADVIRRVGLFDEAFGPYGYEEKDLCRRITGAGYKIAVANTVMVRHKGGMTRQADTGKDWHAILLTAGIRYGLKWKTAERPAEKPAPAPVPASLSPSRGLAAEAAQFGYKNPRVSIIIAAHNRMDMTRECLDGILTNTTNYELIFIDNGCTDGTSQYVKNRVPSAMIIRNEENLGVPKARNQGIRASTCDYLVIMDNDVFVKKGWLDDLFNGLKSEGADISGLEAWLLGASHSPVKMCATRGEIFSYLGGACCLFKRKVFESVGLLDEGFSPAYYEDPDICVRAKQAGFKMAWVQTDKIFHKGNQTLVHGQKTFNYQEAVLKSYRRFAAKMEGKLQVEHEKLPPLNRKLRILYAAMQYDYGAPERGNSFEHDNFYPGLASWDKMGEMEHFDYVALGRQHGIAKMSDMLYDKVQTFCPDCVFAVWFNPEHDPRKEILKKIALTTPTKTIGWFCDSHWRYDNFDRPWADYLSFNVTTSTAAYEKYIKDGLSAKTIKSQWGASPKYQKLPNIPRDIEVSFVGQPHGDRRQVVEAIKAAGVKLQVFGSGWPRRLSFDEMIYMFNRSKISLNLNNACDAKHKQIKGRNFEVPACGGFLLTGEAENLQDYYAFGKEIVTFGSTGDMVDKIKYFLADDKAREEIAAAGYARTMRDHTYATRFDHIFSRAGLLGGKA